MLQANANVVSTLYTSTNISTTLCIQILLQQTLKTLIPFKPTETNWYIFQFDFIWKVCFLIFPWQCNSKIEFDLDNFYVEEYILNV